MNGGKVMITARRTTKWCKGPIVEVGGVGARAIDQADLVWGGDIG